MRVAAVPPREVVKFAGPPHGGTKDVVWRQLGRHLWVGRSEDTHVGIIEGGRRFTLIDAHNNAYFGFRSLEAAQNATCSIPVPPSGAAVVSRSANSRRSRNRLPTLSTALAAALMSAGAFTVAAGIGASIITIR